MTNTEVNQLIYGATRPSTSPIWDRATNPTDSVESIHLCWRDIEDNIDQYKSSGTFLAYTRVGNNYPTYQIQPNARG